MNSLICPPSSETALIPVEPVVGVDDRSAVGGEARLDAGVLVVGGLEIDTQVEDAEPGRGLAGVEGDTEEHPPDESGDHGQPDEEAVAGGLPLRHDARETQPAPLGIAPGVDDRHPGLGDVVQALLLVALETPGQQLADLRGRVGRKPGPLGLLVQDRPDGVGNRLALEDPVAGEHLEEDHAEGPDAGLPVDRFAVGLLG